MEMPTFCSITHLLVFVFTLIVSIIAGASKNSELPELPYCDPDSSDKYDSQKLVFVSTLDGRLSALNADDGGTVVWSIITGPGPMLSSSIHRLELTNNGHWVRMIPSLRGGLYKFNGDNIEVVPVTADHLLQSSSFLFTDGLVISGGKESRTYGVSMRTGKVLYECSMKGCDNFTEDITVEKDVLVIQRQTQTVRAIEARTGHERWNFSVGQHDLKFLNDPNANCHKTGTDRSHLDFKLEVIVPEGLICAASKSKPEKLLWKHKFDSPVVAAWQVKNSIMDSVDLFSGSQWSSSYTDDVGPISPSLYIGMHKKQLYIQESVTMQDSFGKISSQFITDEPSNYLQIPWKPIPATSTALKIISTDTESDTSLQVIDGPTTALSVLYASEYVNGNGYYLFSKDTLKRAQGVQCGAIDKENITIETSEEKDHDAFEFSDDETPVQIIIVSLWYWWKEVLVISITTAVLVNLMVTQRVLQLIQMGTTREIITQKIIVVEKPVTRISETELECDLHLPIRSHSDPGGQLTSDFTSRYLTDFEPVHCLGKGGFGIVFEAKNKIDECNYAIKRIALPNSQESRDRVMREVKALAKLDHHHIVRYFNAWLECPPPGWQEEHDKFLSSCMEDVTSIDLTGLSKGAISSGHNTFNETFSERNNPSVFLNIQGDRKFEDKNDSSENYEDSMDKSDSFIVFESSGKHLLQGHNPEDSTCVKDSVITVSCAENEESRTSPGKQDSSTSGCCVLRKKPIKRPVSLNINSDGGVLVPVKASRVYLYIQMQLCHKESLREWLRDNIRSRDTQKVLQMFEQIVQAVEYVHLQGLIHRDLKPSNIFFSMNGQIKVGDFGLVTAMVENAPEQRTPCYDQNNSINNEKHTAQVGTQLYMSPEQMNGQPYDYKVDIYSLGLILFELLIPFGTQMERMRTLMDLRQNKFPTDFHQQFQQEYELLQQMLSHSPELRPTTFGIRARPPLCHNYSKEMSDNQWHFELPPRSRGSSRTSLSNSSSLDS